MGRGHETASEMVGDQGSARAVPAVGISYVLPRNIEVWPFGGDTGSLSDPAREAGTREESGQPRQKGLIAGTKLVPGMPKVGPVRQFGQVVIKALW